MKFCVDYKVGTRFAIKVTGGGLPKGSAGLLSTKSIVLIPGDCLTASLQLSRPNGFNRFAFNANLKRALSPVTHNKDLIFLNSIRGFASHLTGDSENLVAGLAIGIDTGLSKQFLQNMKSTGLTHLTAVSGANCAIVLAAFWFLGKKLRIGRKFRFFGSVAALAFYVLLVGPQPSVLRAAFLMTVVLFAYEFGRKVWIPAALGIGSALLLVTDPWLVADYGFWLSVLATFGLVILTPKLTAAFELHLPKSIAVALAATIAAQLWCLPLLAELQGGFTTYSILANLLVEPTVPLITLLGLLSMITGAMSNVLGTALLSVPELFARWIVFVANSLSAAPVRLLGLPTGAIGFLLIALFIVSSSIALLKRNKLAVLSSVLLPLIWFGSQLGGAATALTWPIQGWQIVSCDVGQGDALVIRGLDKIAVIDVGKDPDLIDACLDRIGVARIDLLVLTHFDLDHVGGISGALRGRKVIEAMVSPYHDPRPEAEALKRTLESIAGEVVSPKLGAHGTLGNYSWQVFSSLEGDAQTANQGSLGIRFESADVVIYTMADLDEYAQNLAVGAVSASSKPTIVKVSHHGSADQSPDFYSKIEADLGLISVGLGNPYGHPTSKILKILSATQTEVMRTDKLGSISVRIQHGQIDARVSGAR